MPDPAIPLDSPVTVAPPAVTYDRRAVDFIRVEIDKAASNAAGRDVIGASAYLTLCTAAGVYSADPGVRVGVRTADLAAEFLPREEGTNGTDDPGQEGDPEALAALQRVSADLALLTRKLAVKQGVI